MLEVVRKKVERNALLAGTFFLPQERRRSLERWLRGREEFQRLKQADCVVASYAKSGRTWLRVMLSHYGYKRRADRGIAPRLFFTHDNYLGDYTGHADSKQYFAGKRVVLLVRNPQDVAVSQFFHWKHRMKRGKRWINRYPDDENTSLWDFVMHSGSGVQRAVDFMNGWARELPRLGGVRVVRYEDLRAQPFDQLRRVVAFLEARAPDEAALRDAVAYGSVENMRRLEADRSLPLGARLAPGDRSNPDSFKVRRAVVGGYRDYLDDNQTAELDAWVESHLDPVFGYGRRAPPSGEQGYAEP